MANSVDNDQTSENGEYYILIRLLRMTNSVDPDQTAENDKSVDPVQTENCKDCRPRSDCQELQTVLTLIRLLRMANSVDNDQTSENGEYYILIRLLRTTNSEDPDQTAENDKSVDPVQTENCKDCRPRSDCQELQTV